MRNTVFHADKAYGQRKHRRLPLLVLLICFVLAGALTSRAEQQWSEKYYRATDTADRLSQAERDSIDRECLEVLQKFHIDFACLSMEPENHSGITFREIAEEYYGTWEYGYGETKDGFFYLFDVQSGEGEIIPFGKAENLIPDSYLEMAVQKSLEYFQEYGVHGVMYGGLRYISIYLEKNFADGAASETSQDVAVAAGGAAADNADAAGTLPAGEVNMRVGEGGSLPAWYPVDPSSFREYHDADASRVVDDADIFTEEEEARMEAQSAAIRSELNKDIVIYTNRSACGLGHDVMAADFYDFNGYGCGDEYEGVCLYICMDPEDRGWWVACTGSETMGLYTEEYANELDDALYDYMADGQYGTGVLDWIGNFRTLYAKGFPFAPDWYPDRGEAAPPRFHDSKAPRVVDDSGILTEAEILDLENYAKEISDTWGLDVVLHIAPRSGALSQDTFARLFYECNGYGLGEDYDGILLTVFQRPGYYSRNTIYASGKGLDRLTEVNRNRLSGFVRDGMDKDRYYSTLKRYLQQTDHMERTGRVPRSTLYWILVTAFAALAGGVIGGGSLLFASLRMSVPKMQENADAYLVDGSLEVRNLGEVFLGSSVATRYIPPVTRSSGGSSSSSSGRSSYRSSYHGSSGRSHSGSGRKF